MEFSHNHLRRAAAMKYEQVLREKTFKEDDLDIGRRTFYTLRQDPPRTVAEQTAANSKLLGLLLQHLAVRGLITADEIDTMLFETVG